MSTNISFSNMFKEFRISANNCKKPVSLGGYKLYPQIWAWFSEGANPER